MATQLPLHLNPLVKVISGEKQHKTCLRLLGNTENWLQFHSIEGLLFEKKVASIIPTKKEKLRCIGSANCAKVASK